MKEKLTLLITLSITLVYAIGYICSPIAVAASFTEQRLNNNIVSIETIIEEETQKEQGVPQNIEENSIPEPPSSESVHTEVPSASLVTVRISLLLLAGVQDHLRICS